MAKKKAVSKETSARGKSVEPSKKGSSGTKLPAASGKVNSPELSANVSQEDAIREKVRLYPKARVEEIVGMFELEGLKISTRMVQRIKKEMQGDLA